MTGQESIGGLPFNPLNEGLYDRYVDADHTVNHAAWLRAHAAGDSVGTCRIDGGPLQPLQPYEQHGKHWYEAECASCHHTYLAPRGQVLRRSSRKSERTKEAA